MARNVAQVDDQTLVTSETTSGTTDFDVSRYKAFDVTLTSTRTFTFSEQDTQRHQQELVFVIKQTATSGGVVTWPANVKAPTPTLSTVASKVDVIRLISVEQASGAPVWRAVKVIGEGTA